MTMKEIKACDRARARALALQPKVKTFGGLTYLTPEDMAAEVVRAHVWLDGARDLTEAVLFVRRHSDDAIAMKAVIAYGRWKQGWMQDRGLTIEMLSQAAAAERATCETEWDVIANGDPL